MIRRGYRVGTIKHHIHDFAIDQPGKDSWRHFRAGAETVVLASPHQMALVKKTGQEIPLVQLRETYFGDVDLMLAEGYKLGNYPKIEVFRSSVHDSPLFLEDNHLLALVSDVDFPSARIPCFGLEEIRRMGDFVEEHVLKKKP